MSIHAHVRKQPPFRNPNIFRYIRAMKLSYNSSSWQLQIEPCFQAIKYVIQHVPFCSACNSYFGRDENNSEEKEEEKEGTRIQYATACAMVCLSNVKVDKIIFRRRYCIFFLILNIVKLSYIDTNNFMKKQIKPIGNLYFCYQKYITCFINFLNLSGHSSTLQEEGGK